MLLCFVFFQSCEEDCKTCHFEAVFEDNYDPTGALDLMATALGYSSYEEYINATLMEDPDFSQELCGDILADAEAGVGDFAPTQADGYTLTFVCD